ncbi:MAG: DNA cytosine methyltransferase [Clostridia bacterium]|nr:DNA cytosine methyltransferase [Clostridia bacterium]
MHATNDCLFNNEFIQAQIQKSLSKTIIYDGSVDKAELERNIISYYEKKFRAFTEEHFQYDFIDLFCGAGGLSVGFEHEGFRPIIAVDKDLSALLTYRFNRPWLSEENLIHDDIRELVKKDIFPHVPVIVGGPPCQGFSVANKQKKENDERNDLYKFYVHAVKQSQPKVFLMENVEGILKLYDKIKCDFENIGYIVCEPLILSPKDFGFPQSRKRAFILGINDKYKNIVDELYSVFKISVLSKITGTKYTLWDAISDLPELEAKTMKNATNVESKRWGYTIAGMSVTSTPYSRLINEGIPDEHPLLNHRSKYNNERDIQIYRLLKPGEKSDAESIQDINPYKNRANIFRDKFDKLIADEPCKAITAHMYYDCNMYIHPYQARGLTPREAARVQGFPDDYFFLGSPNEWYRQIGNAVSPLIARILAHGLKNVLKRMKADD